MRVFLALWSLLWVLCLPLILLYLRVRARRDPLYARHLAERFGRYPQRMTGTVWLHAVSVGEMRSARPLVDALLARGEVMVLTCFTPTARREAEATWAGAIAAGRLAVVWLPFELAVCYRGFMRAFRPRLALVIEVEIWPRMVQAAKGAGVPIFMVNALYPARAMVRDRQWPLRPAVMRRFDGALVKSDLHAARFAATDVPNITVTGELRFDQPPPAAQIAAAAAARAALAPGRAVLTFGPIPEPEEELILSTITALLARPDPPLIVLVPRAPERFDPMAAQLAGLGLAVLRRSQGFAPDLTLRPGTLTPQILLGDSMGEMGFYQAMADRVLIGGGFNPKGAHTIIEALALGRPVVVGPNTANAEYPVPEAIAAGICRQTGTDGLLAALTTPWPGTAPRIAAFLQAHGGATARSLAALAPHLTPEAGA